MTQPRRTLGPMETSHPGQGRGTDLTSSGPSFNSCLPRLFSQPQMQRWPREEGQQTGPLLTSSGRTDSLTPMSFWMWVAMPTSNWGHNAGRQGETE